MQKKRVIDEENENKIDQINKNHLKIITGYEDKMNVFH